MRAVLVVVLLAALTAACDGGTTTDEAGDTATQEASGAAAEEAVWSDGISELRSGDCFLKSATDESTTFDLLDCGVTHDGEVTTVEDCLHGDDEVRLAAIASFVDVPVEELFNWLDSQQLVAMEHWKLGVGSVCYLAAVDGQLTVSYRR